MKIVIDIPNELYKGIEERDGSLETEYVCDELMKAVDNGTVLPKGHGELIDKEQLFNIPLGGEYTLKDATKYGNLCAEQQHFSYSTLMMYELADIIDDAPTVIEADREVDDGRENG